MHLAEEDIKRFWERVNICGENECWNWLAGKTKGGYGVFKIKRKSYYAHRIAWELTNGKISEGIDACHHCDNRGCCNPAHCFLGTQADNASDMCRKGRQAQGISNGRAKLSDKQVVEIRNLRQRGMILRKLANLYKVHFSTIWNICKYKTWKKIY